MKFRPLTLLLGATLFSPLVAPFFVQAADSKIETKKDGPLSPVDLDGIENALKWSDTIFSGSCPNNEKGYAALAKRGIQTVVTVDGAKPDLKIAQKYGLRYVHIPVRYSGIAREDALKIIRAVRDLPGPVFIHCHHGKHRGPAAAAMAAMALAGYDNQKAKAALGQSGTGLNYKGLWADVENFQKPTQAEINAADNSFPPEANPDDTATAMVSIDERLDNLKLVAKNAWKPVASHPDIDPAHEALLLREAYTELLRTPETLRYGAAYESKMKAAQEGAQKLETAIRSGKNDEAIVAFDALEASCGDCHRVYRDVK